MENFQLIERRLSEEEIVIQATKLLETFYETVKNAPELARITFIEVAYVPPRPNVQAFHFEFSREKDGHFITYIGSYEIGEKYRSLKLQRAEAGENEWITIGNGWLSPLVSYSIHKRDGSHESIDQCLSAVQNIDELLGRLKAGN